LNALVSKQGFSAILERRENHSKYASEILWSEQPKLNIQTVTTKAEWASKLIRLSSHLFVAMQYPLGIVAELHCDDLDEYGEPKKKPIKPMMYTDIATDHEYNSANTAHKKCEKALMKLKEAIKDLI